MAQVTEAQRKAAGNLGSLAGFNADSTKNQLGQQLANYDMSDVQNRSLADVQLDQNSRKAAGDRFGANKKLQTATHGVLGAAGNALQGSSLFELLNMLNTRTDLDNNEVWSTLTQNQNAVNNAYQEAFNANRLSRNDAASNAEFGLRGIEADTASQLNNINPDLFVAPGSGASSVGATGTYDKTKQPAAQAQLSGYIMPDAGKPGATKVQGANQQHGGSYFDQLMNQYNQR